MNLAKISELRKLNYKWTKIASLMKISRATLYRKLKQYNILSYTEISENELDELMQYIKIDHPHDGEVMMQGHLLSLNVKIRRKHLRESIRRVDPAGVISRSKKAVKRRLYSVPHPNALWHIDSHHKLIRWKFVIHAAIDGFS